MLHDRGIGTSVDDVIHVNKEVDDNRRGAENEEGVGKAVLEAGGEEKSMESQKTKHEVLT